MRQMNRDSRAEIINQRRATLNCNNDPNLNAFPSSTINNTSLCSFPSLANNTNQNDGMNHKWPILFTPEMSQHSWSTASSFHEDDEMLKMVEYNGENTGEKVPSRRRKCA